MKYEGKCSSRTSCGPEALLSVLRLPPCLPLVALSRALRRCCPTHMALGPWGTIVPSAFSSRFSSAQGTAQGRGAFWRITRPHPRPIKSDFGERDLSTKGIPVFGQDGEHAFSARSGASGPTSLFPLEACLCSPAALLTSAFPSQGKPTPLTEL